MAEVQFNMNHSIMLNAVYNHPYPIIARVIRKRELRCTPIEDIETAKLDMPEVLDVDVRIYLVKLLEDIGKEVNKERERADQIQKEFWEYKRNQQEYEMFLKFKRERGTY